MKYTLHEINSLINSGINYEAPDDLLELINDLTSQVGSPNYVKTPVFTKPKSDKDKKKTHRKKRTNEEWKKTSTFKATTIDKSVGINKCVDEIRLYLNKLSDTNFDDVFINIVKIIDNLDNDENYENIGNIIFEIASSNKFYSKTYAKLYSSLSLKYNFMINTMKQYCELYIETFNDIRHINPNDNYEGFCEVNKENERRRSLSTFLVNLMKNNALSRDVINNLLVTLLCKFDELLNSDNVQNEANEFCENICILFDDEYDYSNYTIKNTISVNNYLNNLAKSNISAFKSYTNKTKFKIMDLLNM